MPDRQNFIAIGEEAARGTKESSTVGYIPIRNFSLPKPDYMARKRDEYRGEQRQLGHTAELRMGEKWDGLSPEILMFSEAGTTKGMLGTLLKHFFGTVATAQNGATGQYAHMFYPIVDPFGASNLDVAALTANMNVMHDTVLKNYPYVGARVKKLSLKQDTGDHLIMTPELFGQTLAALEAGLSSPAWPAENLRFDYNNLTIRAGATVTRTGTAPDYTNITSNGAVVSPDSITLEFDRGYEDKMLLDGTTSPSRTKVGMFTGKLSMTIDFLNPASGFSSVDEFTAWLAASSTTNFLLTWDTGTAAGTGDNHSLIIDLPVCNRLGGMPDFPLDDDPTVTLEYDFHYDPTTTLYAAGVLLKNTAAAV